MLGDHLRRGSFSKQHQRLSLSRGQMRLPTSLWNRSATRSGETEDADRTMTPTTNSYGADLKWRRTTPGAQLET
jgi:hypothetical protein